MTEVLPKSTEKKRHYCCACSNYRGKIVNGLPITLHRFPTEGKLRKLWCQRLKSVNTNFVFNFKNDRLCSGHFKDGVYNKSNPLPCSFIINNKEKTFKLSKIEDSVCSPPSITPSRLESENMEIDYPLITSTVDEFASLSFHDYAGRGSCKFTVTSNLPKNTQTDYFSETCATQTEVLETSVKEFCTRGTQTDSFKSTCEVGIQVKNPDIVIEDIKTDEMSMFYTGLPNVETFYLCFEELDDVEDHINRKGSGENKGRPRLLRTIDEFFLVLMRLRLGLLLEDLAKRFNISKSTCSNITNQWTSYLSVKLSSLVAWPDKSTIKETMPSKFKKKYPNCRVIIDCTEFYTQTPQSLTNKSLMYSHYKSHMTWKALIGISPSGIITFASDLWNGSTSDKQITKDSGLLDLCEPGDGIMADKGFLISDLTTPRGIELIIPPFKLQRFNRRQVEETRRIANLRINVERAMERIKNFRILQGVMPITLSKQASKILKICVALSNLYPPLMNDNGDD